MITVNRELFMRWAQGLLLERDQEAVVICADLRIHQQAEEAMERGETIGLKVGDRVVSTMALTDDGSAFVETAVTDKASDGAT